MLLLQGSTGPAVTTLQKALISLGYLKGTADGDFGPKTEDAVEDFQAAANLFSDGKAGHDTLEALNAAVTDPALKVPQPLPGPTPAGPVTKLQLVTVPCEKMGGGGYTSMKMRSDVAELYKKLHAEVIALGGGITTAGCIRPLSAGGGAAQSATSLHYCAIAWDLALDSGMQNVNNPYLVENVGNRKWRVWMKCVGNATVPQVTVQATLCSTVAGRTQLQVVPVTGQYVDFTALAAKYGFKNISGRKTFFAGGSYAGAEFWHLQNESVLLPGVSTFGGELLKIYDEATIKANFRGNWDQAKNAIWQISWF